MEQATSSACWVSISNFRAAILNQKDLQAEGPQHEGEIAEQGIEGMLLKGVCESVAGIFRHPFRFQSESPPGRRATFRGEARRLFERRTGAA